METVREKRERKRERNRTEMELVERKQRGEKKGKNPKENI